MTAPRFTHATAASIAETVRKTLLDAGVPKDLVKVDAHEDVREGGHHQTYIHVEAWAPGPGLAAEIDAAEAEAKARKAKADAEAKAAADAEKAAAKPAKKASA